MKDKDKDDKTKTPNITIEAVAAVPETRDRRIIVKPNPPLDFSYNTLPPEASPAERAKHEESQEINQTIADHTNALIEQHEEVIASSTGPFISMLVRVDGHAMGLSLDSKELPDDFLADPHKYVDYITDHALRMYAARPQPV